MQQLIFKICSRFFISPWKIRCFVKLCLWSSDIKTKNVERLFGLHYTEGRAKRHNGTPSCFHLLWTWHKIFKSQKALALHKLWFWNHYILKFIFKITTNEQASQLTVQTRCAEVWHRKGALPGATILLPPPPLWTNIHSGSQKRLWKTPKTSTVITFYTSESDVKSYIKVPLSWHRNG